MTEGLLSSRLSVVIAAHAPDLVRLRRVLEALRTAVERLPGTETIIVRNGGPAIADDVLDAGPTLRLIDEDRLGIAFARATGIATSSGTHIVFVDDDTVVAPDYLERAAGYAAQSPEVGVFGGRIVGEFVREPSPAVRAALPFLALRDLGEARKTVGPQEEMGFDVPGAGMVLRHDVAIAFHDMVEDGRLGGIGRAGTSLASGDDTACCLIARRMGLSLAYVPALRLTHIIPPGRVEPGYLRRLVRGIGGSAARLDAIFEGPETICVISHPQLWGRKAVHIMRNGLTGGLITSGWHEGYREQALRERKR